MALFTQDFLMRQVQQLTQLLQQIIFRKKQNQYQEAIEDIHDAFRRLTKDHPKAFNELTLEETLGVFTNGNQFRAELALAVADLLVEEGEMLTEKSYSASQKCYSQALLLYKKSLRDEKAAVPLDIRETIDELEDLLSHSDYLDTINQILAKS